MICSTANNHQYLVKAEIDGVPHQVPAVAGILDIEPCPTYNVVHTSIEHYLNPNLFENEETLQEIAGTLASDNLVVIRDAFIPEFAEALHCDIDRLEKWQLDTGYFEDGSHFSYHSIKNRAHFSELMNSTLAVFEHPDTKKFMASLSGRKCMGETQESSASVCYHMSGDYSLPRSYHLGQRTVAYQWLLSKNWQPEWGGALYWTPELTQNKYVHADFNTLALLSINSQTEHFITPVSPHAQEKRLSFNGWYHSDWMPSLDDPLEDLLENAEDRWRLTRAQAEQILELVHGSAKDHIESERRVPLEKLVGKVVKELWPRDTESIVEL